MSHEAEKIASARWAREMIQAADAAKAHKDLYPNLKKYKTITDEMKNEVVAPAGKLRKPYLLSDEDFLALKKGQRPNSSLTAQIFKPTNADMIPAKRRPSIQNEVTLDSLMSKYFPKPKPKPVVEAPAPKSVPTENKPLGFFSSMFR